jgi:hypothetical protein
MLFVLNQYIYYSGACILVRIWHHCPKGPPRKGPYMYPPYSCPPSKSYEYNKAIKSGPPLLLPLITAIQRRKITKEKLQRPPPPCVPPCGASCEALLSFGVSGRCLFLVRWYTPLPSLPRGSPSKLNTAGILNPPAATTSAQVARFWHLWPFAGPRLDGAAGVSPS